MCLSADMLAYFFRLPGFSHKPRMSLFLLPKKLTCSRDRKPTITLWVSRCIVKWCMSTFEKFRFIVLTLAIVSPEKMGS